MNHSIFSLGGITLLAALLLGAFSAHASDRALLNRLGGAYNGRMNTELFAYEPDDPPEPGAEGQTIAFTGKLRLPRRKGQTMRARLRLTDIRYTLSAQVNRIKVRKRSVTYLGMMTLSRDDGETDIGIRSPYTGRFRGRASIRGRREKLTFPVNLIHTFEDPDPFVYQLLGRFNGVK